MEKVSKFLLAIYISYLVETYGLLISMHIRGKKGQSIKKTLYEIVEKVYAGWNKDRDVFLLVLDISGAYNYICQHQLQYNLCKYHFNL